MQVRDDDGDEFFFNEDDGRSEWALPAGELGQALDGSYQIGDYVDMPQAACVCSLLGLAGSMLQQKLPYADIDQLLNLIFVRSSADVITNALKQDQFVADEAVARMLL